ncbi:MAG: hypothetical protein SAL07_20590 [Oscillatoria sp. PMC 1051.18]|nr:hypothetical protein [Oscillatoria sp. PMC 1050.18]MEC5032305.1 hypothetical protein [Oscillatoria sp. PMC 1051.18]
MRRFRVLAVVIFSCVFWVASLVVTPSASALTQIQLSDLSYHECPAEIGQGIVSSGGGSRFSKCYLVTGKANNKSGKTVYDADVFGRIYDANNNPVMQNRSRVGSIAEVPPGVSDFQIRITVSANQSPPLKLKQFKASGFSSPVRW